MSNLRPPTSSSVRKQLISSCAPCACRRACTPIGTRWSVRVRVMLALPSELALACTPGNTAWPRLPFNVESGLITSRTQWQALWWTLAYHRTTCLASSCSGSGLWMAPFMHRCTNSPPQQYAVTLHY